VLVIAEESTMSNLDEPTSIREPTHRGVWLVFAALSQTTVACLMMFVLLKIVPFHLKQWKDWGAELFPASVALVHVCNYAINTWYLLPIVALPEWLLLGMLRGGGSSSRLAAEILNMLILVALAAFLFFELITLSMMTTIAAPGKLG